MPWMHVLACWPHLIAPLCARFPHLDRDTLARCGGDRDRIEKHLAETHDLTHAEACDALADWLELTGLRLSTQTAAAA